MTITVSSGVTSSGLTLSAGDTANIMSGGTAEMFVVSSGGNEIVSSGGQSLDDTIDSGGLLTLSSGGVASSLTISSAAVASGGGTLAGATTDDGLVSGLQVGGVLSVGSGGVAQGMTILSGGSAAILSGGIDSGSVVLSGGLETVSQGGSATALSLASGATLTDNGVVTYSGATTVTLAGAVIGGGTLVQDGAGELVISATAPVSVDVTVSGTDGPWSPSENPSLDYGSNPVGGEASVSGSLSFAVGAQITVTYLSGTVGTEEGDPQYDANGDANFVAEGNGYPGEFIPAGDRPAYHGELLGAFANAAGQVIGSPFVLGDGPTTVTVPADGATQLLLGVNDNGYGDNNGALAIEVAEDGGSGGGSPSLVISGGVAQLAVTGALGGAPVVFAPGAGSSATLEIAAADLPANGASLINPLSNFDAAVDALDLQGLAYVSGATAVASGGVLTVTDGSEVLHFTLEGAIFPSFVASSDGDGGLVVSEQQALIVSAGVVSSGLSVGSGDQLMVLSGGEVEDITVLSGGSAMLSAGAVGAGVTVSSGGQLDGPGELLGSSFDAGQVSGVSVGSAGASGYLEIQSGGSASAVTVVDGELKIDFAGSASGTALSGPDARDQVFGVASGTVVGSGAEEVVASGGVASGTQVLAGGREVVSSGGGAVDATISSGGEDYVLASGTTTGTLISDGGDELVSSGGTASGTAVLSGGAEFVLASGVTTGAQLSSGGRAYVLSGGAASATTVSSGGIEYVLTAGTATGTVLSAGGKEAIESGGAASATTVSSGGVDYVLTSGMATGAVLSDGGKAVIEAGGAAIGTTALSGGTDYVKASGRAAGTVVSDGGHEVLLSGGYAIGATVSSRGEEAISSGGVADATTISSGGYEKVLSGGVSLNAAVLSGGRDYVYSGGQGFEATVSSGGTETVSSGGLAIGLDLLSGGVAIDDGEVRFDGAGTLAGMLSGSGAVIQTEAGDLVLNDSGAAFSGVAAIRGGTIELATSGALGTGYVEFAEPATGSAVLQIDAADAPTADGTFANRIVDFSGANEDIDLRSIAFVAGASATVSGTTLVLTDGGETYKFTLAGSIAGAYPVLSDGHGGTLIDPPSPDPDVARFAQTAAAFAPSDAANAALASATSPTAHTPFAHAAASATAGHI